MLHLINLDAEIYSASQYLPHLYEQQRNVLCKILNEKHQSECAIEQQRKQLSAQINGVQKELDALLTKELTVQISAQEVGITIPDHPNEPQKPVYKTPGLFNKKATLKYNEDLQIQYEQKMQAYHIELERFKAALDAHQEKRQQIHAEKLKEARQQQQAEAAAIKNRLEILQAQENSLTSQQATNEPVSTPLMTLKAELDKEIADFEDLVKKLFEMRASLYNYNIVYGKYRDIVAISTFYEYLLSGRCDSLEGPSGAYNLYENECQANKIIGQLDKVVDSLESIKNTQFMVYDQLQKANQRLDGMQSTLRSAVKQLSSISKATSDIASNTAMIAHNTAMTAYYSKVNAELTNALGFMMALK